MMKIFYFFFNFLLLTILHFAECVGFAEIYVCGDHLGRRRFLSEIWLPFSGKCCHREERNGEVVQ